MKSLIVVILGSLLFLIVLPGCTSKDNYYDQLSDEHKYQKVSVQEENPVYDSTFNMNDRYKARPLIARTR